MQVAFVMMLALTGLGCQNKTTVVVDASAVNRLPGRIPLPSASDQGSGYSTSTYSGSFAPTPYPEIPVARLQQQFRTAFAQLACRNTLDPLQLCDWSTTRT